MFTRVYVQRRWSRADKIMWAQSRYNFRTSCFLCVPCTVQRYKDSTSTVHRLILTNNQINFNIESINLSINETSIAPISPAKPGSVARQPNQCSTAKSRKHFRNINRPWRVTVSMRERLNQRDVSSDIS